MRRLACFCVLFVCILALVVYTSQDGTVSKPVFSASQIKAPFIEQFTDDWESRWKTSEATKVIPKEKELAGEDGDDDDDDEKNGDREVVEFKFNGVWSVKEPTVYPGILYDSGLIVMSPATHHAISVAIPGGVDPKGKSLVVQYEVKFQNSLECGGAYIKLLTQQSKAFNPRLFDDKSPYTIMFGPDKCGFTNKIHFIFRHKNPKTGKYEEKHLKTPPPATISKLSTLYTLVVLPDNTFTIYINQEKVASGSLLEDFDPPVNPPAEIYDVNDVKPVDWIEEAKIPDPSAQKPSDWNEGAPLFIEDLSAEKPENWLEDVPEFIDDPNDTQPENWDEEEDGAFVPSKVQNPKCSEASGCGPWKRPKKKNPDYKGKWFAPTIENPAYKGPWEPRKIPNPDYFEEKTPANFERIGAVGFELWTMQSGILFDNIYIGHSEEDARKFAKETWAVKYAIEKALQEVDEEKTKAESGRGGESTESFIMQLAHQLLEHVVIVLEDLNRSPIQGLQKHMVPLSVVLFLFLLFVLIIRKLFLSKKKKVDPAMLKMKKDDTASSEISDEKTTPAKPSKEAAPMEDIKENKTITSNTETPRLRVRKE